MGILKEKNLNFQEKLLKSVKRHKKKTLKHVLIAFPFFLLFMIIFGVFYKPAVPTVATDNDDLFTASFVGDIMMGRNVEKVTDRHGKEYPFKYAEPFFRSSDYVTGNFEAAVTDGNEDEYVKADKFIHLNTDRDSVTALKKMNFSALTVANNHAMDFTEQGILDTKKAFEQENLDLVGYGENLQEARNNISIQDVNGFKIATLGFTDIYGKEFPVQRSKPGVLTTDPTIMLPMVAKAKKQADFVMVHMHWGIEYDANPQPRQKKLAEALSEAGADVIIGHHPHVISSVDVYNDTVIFYSLGNFVFDQGWSRTRHSALAQMIFQKDGTARFEVLPMNIREGQPVPLGKSGYMQRKKIIQQLTKSSENLEWKEENGKLVFELDYANKLKEKESTENKEKPKMNPEESPEGNPDGDPEVNPDANPEGNPEMNHDGNPEGNNTNSSSSNVDE